LLSWGALGYGMWSVNESVVVIMLTTRIFRNQSPLVNMAVEMDHLLVSL
jgi:hypothetical protein